MSKHIVDNIILFILILGFYSLLGVIIYYPTEINDVVLLKKGLYIIGGALLSIFTFRYGKHFNQG